MRAVAFFGIFATFISAQTWTSIGCYKDNNSTHEFLYGPYSGNNMSPSFCNSLCQRLFKYFGLQDGNQCYCGDDYGKYGTATNCNITCSGDSTSKCGGANANSVYSVGTETLYPNGYVIGCLNVSKNLPFCNVSLSISDRITDLIGRLSLDEKVSFLGADNIHTGVDDCNMMDRGVSSLGIPPYMNLVEVNSAVASACLAPNQCATEFPSPPLLAASFNRSTWNLKGQIISTEMRALNNLGWWRGMTQGYSKIGLTGYGPNINIVRDPRFGRNSELPSEDPYLTGSYAVQYVKGLQEGSDSRYLKMISGLKHFALYSVETNRASFIPNVTTFDLYDTYLPQYKMGFDSAQGNAQATMCSYAGANGVPACANDFLLNQIIRQQWNRPDVLVASDCGAVNNMVSYNHYAKNGVDASAKTINGGTDQDLGDMWFSPVSQGGAGGIQAAIIQGSTDEAHVDSALRRVLEKRFKTGQFDPLDGQIYAKYWSSDVNATSSHNTILDQTLQGLILLKNDKNTLPISQNKKLALVGPFVNVQRDLFEDYKGDQECFSGDDSCVRTIAEVFTNSYGPSYVTVQEGVDISSNDTSRIPAALNAVSASDIVILCIGVGYSQEHEGQDRSDTLLPGQQESFAEQVLALGKPTTIILINGGIVSIDKLIEPAGAIIEAFNPGMRGAEALYLAVTGVSNRWGKLPVTVYPAIYTSQVPMTDFNMTQSPGRTYRYYINEPLFPFGFGLSYTTFGISAVLASDGVTINVIVKNSGTREGDNVIFMYHRVSAAISSSVNHPVPIKQLVDFNRVGSLLSGTTTNFTFLITNDKLTLTNLNGEKVIYPGDHYFDITDGIQIPVTITFNVPQFIFVDKAIEISV